MRIWFKCKTNKDYVMINTAEFVLPNNTALTIDRTQTEYDIDENGILDMTWGGCYLWAVNGYTLFNDEAYITDYDGFSALLKNADLNITLEDDADEDYEVSILAWGIRE